MNDEQEKIQDVQNDEVGTSENADEERMQMEVSRQKEEGSVDGPEGDSKD